MSDTNLRFDLNLDGEGNGSVTLITSDGEIVVVTHDHVNFRQVVNAVMNGEDPTPLLQVAKAVTSIDSRVEVRGSFVTFGGEVIDNSLTQTILRWVREGKDTTGLVLFLENLQANPSQRSREQLFDWVQAKEITITDDGHFIGYKGVRSDLTSSNAGPGIVNGVAVNGHLDNSVGNIVEIERSKVQVDPHVGCASGLHVGNYSYANSFGQVLLEVKVNPRDVVSVPADCSFQKLRCCRYEVLAVHEKDYDDLSDYEPESEYDWDGDWDDDLDVLEPYVEASWLNRLRSRFGLVNKDG